VTDVLELHFIELSKFNKLKPRELQSSFERWLHFLKFGEYYVDEEFPLPFLIGDRLHFHSIRGFNRNQESVSLFNPDYYPFS